MVGYKTFCELLVLYVEYCLLKLKLLLHFCSNSIQNARNVELRYNIGPAEVQNGSWLHFVH